MSRRKKLMLNTGTALVKQIIVVICDFILPRYMLLYYGSSVNGLVSSISHFLGFIAFLDLGVGAVTQSSLYEPLAKKDTVQLSGIIKSSQRFFRRLACIFLGYIAVLCVIFPRALNTEYPARFSVSLLLILSISMFAQYFFGLTYELLLSADQRAYVPLMTQTVTAVLNTAFAVILMRTGASIHAVKLMTASVFVLRPLVLSLYVRKHYEIDRHIVLTDEPIQQKWYGFSQHIAAIILQHIDVAVLTTFSTLINVSIYSVYYRVIVGVEQIITIAFTGLESMLGNMIARREQEKLIRTFETAEWLTHTGVTAIFSITAVTIVPFVLVYTRGVQDADYRLPLFAALLVAAYAFKSLRRIYFCIIKAAGHYKGTQNGAYISALLNVVITIALVFSYGLPGTALGTLIALFYHCCYFIWYLSRHILERPVRYFVRYLLTDSATAAVVVLLTGSFSMASVSYGSWVVLAVKVSLVTIAVSGAVQCIFYRKQIKNGWLLLRRKG